MKSAGFYFVLLSFFLAGCATTLNPEGVYRGDKALYATDASIDSAYKILDVFLSYELANRAALPQEVRDFANKIRREAPEWNRRIFALRDVYALAPTLANKTALDAVLALLRAALTQASAYLVEKPTI